VTRACARFWYPGQNRWLAPAEREGARFPGRHVAQITARLTHGHWQPSGRRSCYQAIRADSIAGARRRGRIIESM